MTEMVINRSELCHFSTNLCIQFPDSQSKTIMGCLILFYFIFSRQSSRRVLELKTYATTPSGVLDY